MLTELTMKIFALICIALIGVATFWFFQDGLSKSDSSSKFKKYENQLEQIHSLDDLREAFNRLPMRHTHGPSEFSNFMSLYKPKVARALENSCSFDQLLINAPGLEDFNLVSRLRQNTDILGIEVLAKGSIEGLTTEHLVLNISHQSELLWASYNFDGSTASRSIPVGRIFSGSISIDGGKPQLFGKNVDAPKTIVRHKGQSIKSNADWASSTLYKATEDTFRIALVEALSSHCTSLGLSVFYFDVSHLTRIEERLQLQISVPYAKSNALDEILLEDINQIAPLLYLIHTQELGSPVNATGALAKRIF